MDIRINDARQLKNGAVLLRYTINGKKGATFAPRAMFEQPKSRAELTARKQAILAWLTQSIAPKQDQRVELANKIAAALTTATRQASVWVSGDGRVVRVYIKSGKRDLGHVALVGNTLRDGLKGLRAAITADLNAAGYSL